MKELELKYGCNPNQKPSRIYMKDGELPIEVLNGKPGYINFLDAFTGGSFSSFSIFALNITPYITSSIIIQLLTDASSGIIIAAMIYAISPLEQLHTQITTASSRTSVGSMLKYSPMPPHTPHNIRSRKLRYNRLPFITKHSS